MRTPAHGQFISICLPLPRFPNPRQARHITPPHNPADYIARARARVPVFVMLVIIRRGLSSAKSAAFPEHKPRQIIPPLQAADLLTGPHA